MQNLKPYSCPNCKRKLPIKYIFLLGNNSNVVCSNCGMVSSPEKMGPWAVSLGFLSFTIPFELARYKSFSFLTSVSIGLAIGLLCYTSVLIYVYNKVVFKMRF